MTENIKEITETLEQQFNKLLKINSDLMKSLNQQQLKEVLPMQTDINNILNAVKNGDILAINEINKRYASTNK